MGWKRHKRNPDEPTRLLSDVRMAEKDARHSALTASPVVSPPKSVPPPTASPPSDPPVAPNRKPSELKRSADARAVLARAIADRNDKLDRLYP